MLSQGVSRCPGVFDSGRLVIQSTRSGAGISADGMACVESWTPGGRWQLVCMVPLLHTRRVAKDWMQSGNSQRYARTVLGAAHPRVPDLRVGSFFTFETGRRQGRGSTPGLSMAHNNVTRSLPRACFPRIFVPCARLRSQWSVWPVGGYPQSSCANTMAFSLTRLTAGEVTRRLRPALPASFVLSRPPTLAAACACAMCTRLRVSLFHGLLAPDIHTSYILSYTQYPHPLGGLNCQVAVGPASGQSAASTLRYYRSPQIRWCHGMTVARGL